jgi:hypothetical protein
MQPLVARVNADDVDAEDDADVDVPTDRALAVAAAEAAARQHDAACGVTGGACACAGLCVFDR